MIERRWRPMLVLAAVALGTAVLFWLWPRRTPPMAEPPPSRSPAASAPAPSSVATTPAAAARAPFIPPAPPAAPVPPHTPPTDAELTGESRLADDLNAPGGTIQRDLAILEEVFVAWLTNFPRTGNPVGENAEITAALAGDNPVKFAFVPRRHRAINASGELCDRWGTPFRFHQLSGRQMEIRSAGPDRRFGTTDDAVLSPSP
jgi:hypothetical protein